MTTVMRSKRALKAETKSVAWDTLNLPLQKASESQRKQNTNPKSFPWALDCAMPASVLDTSRGERDVAVILSFTCEAWT